jgi:hypothetical protein
VNFNDPSGSIRCWIDGFDFGGVGGDDGGSACWQDPCTFLINNLSLFQVPPVGASRQCGVVLPTLPIPPVVLPST